VSLGRNVVAIGQAVLKNQVSLPLNIIILSAAYASLNHSFSMITVYEPGVRFTI